MAFVIKFLLLSVGKHWALLPWSEKAELATSVLCAFVLGALFAAFANNDKFHALMRRIKVTRETSYPSEWYGAFCNHVTYVVLHLKGERRIYGWPIEWPSESGDGHFLLEQASWLGDDNKEIPITNVTHVLIPETVSVKWPEIVLSPGDVVQLQVSDEGPADEPVSRRSTTEPLANLFSDEDLARELLSHCQDFERRLFQLMKKAESIEPLEEYERFKRAIGNVVVDLGEHFLRPVWRRHPNLIPDSMRGELL